MSFDRASFSGKDASKGAAAADSGVEVGAAESELALAAELLGAADDDGGSELLLLLGGGGGGVEEVV